jgi:ubiquinone/menaquinone biosynthesis C-methylase UbiE
MSHTTSTPHHTTPTPRQNGALCAPYVFPAARVLVIGAGHGTDAIYCAKTFPEAEVTALDLSPTMLAQLDGRRKKEIPQATNLKLVRDLGWVFD